ncbi:uncharacterized protein LOC142339565 isoform X2 [Convolutriloba macropyga]|uniref:uncharacterized protein LOC142339565 isoform X2 n=1 Tax=Convolutriloba macropyga TaxID=536237 RepID=UPI003F51B156
MPVRSRLAKALDTYRVICQQSSSAAVSKRLVYFSFHFIKFGEVDTKNQTFKAKVIVEARWYEPFLENYTKKAEFEHYSGPLWDPKLIIVNLEAVQAGINEVAESIKVDSMGHPYIHHTRRVRGVFFEKMELFEFPRDVQDLSVTVMSELSSDEIELMEDTVLPSSIKQEMFQDENNFSLFDHVQILPGVIPDPTKQTNFSVPIISATCRVARNPMFFIWNNYLIMTCLVFISLSCFAIDPKDVKYRLTVILTILLTSVTFKLSTAGKLPMISYNTMLDLYILISMLILMAITVEISILSIWKEEPIAKDLDKWSVLVIGIGLVLYHLLYWAWFLYVTSRRHRKIRKLVEKADEERTKSGRRKGGFERKGFLKCMKVHQGLEYVREFKNDRIPHLGSVTRPENDDVVTVTCVENVPKKRNVNNSQLQSLVNAASDEENI